MGVHVSPTVFFNVRKFERVILQGANTRTRELKSAASAVASPLPSGESGSPKT